MVFWLLALLCAWTVFNHHCEEREGVKWMLFETWLKSGELPSSSGSMATKRDRRASKRYETARTGDGFAGDDFQNTGTFIVVKSTVFAKSSAQKTHLARDAYNALSLPSGASQVQSISLTTKALLRLTLKKHHSFSHPRAWSYFFLFVD